MKKMNSLAALVLIVTALALGSVVAFAQESANPAPAPASEAKVAAPLPYPLDYCLVTGEKLGSMGDAVVKVYDGREVKFCCAMCPPKFEKDKKAYLKKLDDGIIATQKATYPLQTCVVSGEPLKPSDMGDPVDFVYQNRLVRFCCNGCIAAFNKNPDKYLKKIDDAAAAAKPATEGQ